MVELIKEKVFRRWCNSFLLQGRMCMEDLSLDVKDGVKLCRLVELLFRKSIPSFSKTPSEQEKIQNIDGLLVFLKSTEGMVHLTVSRDDILQGDVKAICSLIWSLIIHYQIRPLLPPEKWTLIRESVKELINSKLPPGNQVNNFTSDWMDSTVLAMLAKEQLPSTWNPKGINILEAAEKYIEVPKILFYEELQSPDIDEESVMTYATLLLTKMASSHQADSEHPTNYLFVKVNTGTSSNENLDITTWAKNASTLTGERDISIEISIVSSSAEILVEYFAVSGSINTTTPHITVEAQYVGISTLHIEDVTNYIFTNITDATNSSIYFLLTMWYTDTILPRLLVSPTIKSGWKNPSDS